MSLVSVIALIKFSGVVVNWKIRELAGREADVEDAREPAVAGIAEITPARREIGADGQKLALRDLPGLAEIGPMCENLREVAGERLEGDADADSVSTGRLISPSGPA